MSTEDTKRFQIDDLELDTGARTVMRGEAPLKLGKLSFDLFLELIESAPNVATYDGLATRVWKGRAVTPETIAQRASMLRRALSDNGRSPRYFEVVRGQGFRLLVKIVKHPALAQAEQHNSQRSIAVLPFTNLGGDPQDDYFGDGLVEDITTELSHIPQLFVISRHASFVYRGSSADVQQIGKALGVNYVLQGGFRRQSERLRVTAQLVETTSAQNIWSRKYDRHLVDVLSMQDDLTNEIVTAMDVELVSGGEGRLRRSKYNSVEAGELLYKGMFEYYKFDQQASISARNYFKEFVCLEPESILGYVWLATSWTFALLVGWEDPVVALPNLRENVDRCLAIDSNDPQALVGDTYCKVIYGDLDGALDSCTRATNIAPNFDDAHFVMGWTQMFLGKANLAIGSIKRARKLRPFLPALQLGLLATAYRNAGNYREAIDTFNLCLEHFPDFVFAYAGLAVTYSFAGDNDLAARAVKSVLSMDSTYSVKRFTTPDLYRDKATMERCAEALRGAGMPDD